MGDPRKRVVFLCFLSLLLCFFFLPPSSAATRDDDGKGLSQGLPQGDDGTKRIIVVLDQPPLVAYKGGVTGLKATSPDATGRGFDPDSRDSRAYRSYLEGKQRAFEQKLATVASSPRITHRYSTATNGISVRVPESVVDQLSKMEGVKAVYVDKERKLDTTVSPALVGANTFWESLGGVSRAGEGVIVGIIDTGIWPEHPSFSNPDQSGNNYMPPRKSWRGQCEAPLDSSAPITCTNKLIGARAFLDTYKDEHGGLPVGDFDSARDSEGHGTHVASTAAGNHGVDALIGGNGLGKISGIAPRAHVAVYRVCSVEGCWDSDSMAAIDKAVEDGVDVLNYSISAGEDPYDDPVQLAFLNAYRAGIFVASSAGNSGPAANTVGKRGGWMASVAATSNSRAFSSTISLTDDSCEPKAAFSSTISLADNGAALQLSGTSVTNGIANPTPIVVARDRGDEYCLNQFSQGTFAGEIVACMRGYNARVQKGYNVLQGGAGGMILYNPDWAPSLVPDTHYLPTVHISDTAGTALLDFLSYHPQATGTFTNGTAVDAQKDVVADFSSRGGTGQTYGISKPDMAAPGAAILAGVTSAPVDVTTAKPGELFGVYDGTSMASPHVAGAAALLKDLRPTWTPGQIQSALMTTALTEGVVKEDGTTQAGPFDCGSGRIDLTKAGNPGITFEVPADDFVARKNNLWLVNYPSVYIPDAPQGTMTITRTAHNTLATTSDWVLWTEAEDGLVITVPPSVKVLGYAKVPFSIRINGNAIPAGEVRHGTIFLRGEAREKGSLGRQQYLLHIPVTVAKRPPT